MPQAALALTIISAASAVHGAVEQARSRRDSRKEQRRRRRTEIAKEKLIARRKRVQATLERQRAEASSQTQAVAQGGAGGLTSSGFQGASGSLQSQFNSNLGFSNLLDQFTSDQNRSKQREADRTGKAQDIIGFTGAIGSGARGFKSTIN